MPLGHSTSELSISLQPGFPVVVFLVSIMEISKSKESQSHLFVHLKINTGQAIKHKTTKSTSI